MTASNVVDSRGNPLHTVVQIQDITEQKWAQALLAHQRISEYDLVLG